jgi:LEA14-like dessication related protein
MLVCRRGVILAVGLFDVYFELSVYVPSGDFDITINDQRLGSGHFGSVTIGGNGRGSVEVRITFLLTDVPMVVIGLITGGGNVTIKVEGSANMLLFGIPFSSTLYNVKLT